MGSVSGSGGTDTFAVNTIRDSGGNGLAFITSGLSTSSEARGSIVMLGGRIENSQGIGMFFDPKFVRNNITDGQPLRIVGSRGNPVHGPLGVVLKLWPNRAEQDSLLGNVNDTLAVWGDADAGELVARPGLVWQFKPHFRVTFGVLGPATVVRIEPGGLIMGSDLRVQGSLIANGTPAQNVRIAHGMFQMTCDLSLGSCPASRISYAQIDDAIVSVSGGWTLDHIVANGSNISLDKGSRITNSVVQSGGLFGSPSVSLGRDTRMDSTAVHNAKTDGLGVFGLNVVIIDCVISGSGRDGMGVFLGGSVQIHTCAIENNTRAGVNADLQAASVDARFNWWGDAAGPFGPSGDGVEGDVDYSLHLTTRPTITPAMRED